MTPRRFLLRRDTDHTGISGVGDIAEGVEFSDGTVVVRWLTTANTAPGVKPTTVIHEEIGSVLALHGHSGSSTVVWLDTPRRGVQSTPPL